MTYTIKAFQAYPEPVAKELRKAVFFTNVQRDVERAVSHYQKAMDACKELQISPFSDEVLGIKVQMAYLFEMAGHYEQAAEVLEMIRNQCFVWVENDGDQHIADGHRSRILGKTVGIGVKLAEYLSDPSVRKDTEAEEVLVSVVDTVLKEQQRRQKKGVEEGEGPWITDEAAGSSFESKRIQLPGVVHIHSHMLQLSPIDMKKQTTTISPRHFSCKPLPIHPQSLATRSSS